MEYCVAEWEELVNCGEKWGTTSLDWNREPGPSFNLGGNE